MIRLSAVVIALLAGLAVACGGGTSSKDKTATAVAKPKSVTVQVDGVAPDHNEVFFQYFPDTVTVRPGDTVKFTLNDHGEPHTVSFGTFASPLFDFITKNCPNGFHAAPCDNPSPELEAQFNEQFSNFPAVIGENPDVNAGPANPCFMDAGELQNDTACPKAAPQPDFNGTQAVYSSGWLPGDQDFSVKLSEDIKAGTYHWICLVHGPEMTGTLTVVDKSASTPSADEVKSAGDAQLSKLVDGMKSTADTLANGTATNVFAGTSSQTLPSFIAEFAPSTSAIPVGGSITWTVDSGHTISFNAPEDAKSLRKVAADGTVHINEKATAPSGVGEPPKAEDPNAPPPLFDGGTWDGSGFLSTGFLQGGEFKLTFSKAGTYTYKCMIHDKMEGTVKVGT